MTSASANMSADFDRDGPREDRREDFLTMSLTISLSTSECESIPPYTDFEDDRLCQTEHRKVYASADTLAPPTLRETCSLGDARKAGADGLREDIRIMALTIPERKFLEDTIRQGDLEHINWAREKLADRNLFFSRADEKEDAKEGEEDEEEEEEEEGLDMTTEFEEDRLSQTLHHANYLSDLTLAPPTLRHTSSLGDAKRAGSNKPSRREALLKARRDWTLHDSMWKAFESGANRTRFMPTLKESNSGSSVTSGGTSAAKNPQRRRSSVSSRRGSNALPASGEAYPSSSKHIASNRKFSDSLLSSDDEADASPFGKSGKDKLVDTLANLRQTAHSQVDRLTSGDATSVAEKTGTASPIAVVRPTLSPLSARVFSSPDLRSIDAPPQDRSSSNGSTSLAPPNLARVSSSPALLSDAVTHAPSATAEARRRSSSTTTASRSSSFARKSRRCSSLVSWKEDLMEDLGSASSEEDDAESKPSPGAETEPSPDAETEPSHNSFPPRRRSRRMSAAEITPSMRRMSSARASDPGPNARRSSLDFFQEVSATKNTVRAPRLPKRGSLLRRRDSNQLVTMMRRASNFTSDSDSQEGVEVSVVELFDSETTEAMLKLNSLEHNHQDPPSLQDVESGEDMYSSDGDEGFHDSWKVLDEFAEEYEEHSGVGGLPFLVLGTSASDLSSHPHVLSPPLMASLRSFFPHVVSEDNFWMKFSLVRDGASMHALLQNIRGANHSIIAVETVDGEVFGSFTSKPWRKNWNYFGTGESFLWRMRQTRRVPCRSVVEQAQLESELEVFPWTGENDCIQLCKHDKIAVGGGGTSDHGANPIADGTAMPTLDAEDKEYGFGFAIESDLLFGTSSPCHTFRSPSLSVEHSDGSPFEIVNLEVWTMTPCMTVEEAEKLELGRLFFERHSDQ